MRTLINTRDKRLLNMTKIFNSLENFNKNTGRKYVLDDIVFLYAYDDEGQAGVSVGVGEFNSSVGFYYFISYQDDPIKSIQDTDTPYVMDDLEGLLFDGSDEEYEEFMDSNFTELNNIGTDHWSDEDFDKVCVEYEKAYPTEKVYRILAVLL